MNTPAHLLIGAAAFARPERKGTTLAAFLGAIAPDLSLYVMVAVSLWIMDIPARTIFGEYYYSDAWQAVFAVDNSFVLWGIAHAVALWRASPVGVAFTGAALLHLLFDFPLHTLDARQHFWPLTDWVFVSPVSYWDTSAHASVVGSLELSLSLVCAVILWRRLYARAWRGVIALLVLLELASSSVWRFIF